MLQAIRDRVTGILAFFILGLLAVPFLFFGMESYMRAVPQDAVAVVGDAEISSSEFQTSFSQYRARLRREQGDDYDDIASNQPEARREHLESMIDELLFRQYASDLGLEVSDQAIAAFIRNVPQFQTGGEFNPDVYRQALRSSGRTPRGFERELAEDMLTRLVPGALAESAIVTEPEIDRLISLQNETRSAGVLRVGSEASADGVEIGEDEVRDYYEANQQAFTTTEQVRLNYVALRDDELVDDQSGLEEEELRRRYEAARERYLTPEARRAAHILIEAGDDEDRARAQAESLRERIAEGEDFADLAREHSDDPVSAEAGGELGWIEPEDMVAPFEDALYGLESAGDVSAPVETRFGWHLIRLEEVRPPQGMSFEQARAEIQEEYLESQRHELFRELSERMVDLVYADDSSLEPLADELGLEIEQTGWFDRSGGEGIAARQEVVEAAFSDLVLLDGAVSDPIEIEPGQMVAIRVDGHRPAEPRPLDEVAGEIRERLLDRESDKLARERAGELAERVRAEDETLDQVAGSAGLEAETLEAVGRNDFQHGPEFVRELFRLPAPGDEPAIHVLPAADGYAVVRLDRVMPGDPTLAGEDERGLIRQQLRYARVNEEIAGLLEWLRDTTDVSVVEDRL